MRLTAGNRGGSVNVPNPTPGNVPLTLGGYKPPAARFGRRVQLAKPCQLQQATASYSNVLQQAANVRIAPGITTIT